MLEFSKYLILEEASVKQALEKLNVLLDNQTLFVTNNENQIVGSLTDGDIRRALLNKYELSDSVAHIMCKNFKFLRDKEFSLKDVEVVKRQRVWLIPVIDKDNKLVRLINLKKIKSILPLDAVIMAGGKGERLRPLTDVTPKPLLNIGDKAIIEYGIDSLKNYGINKVFITLNYLSNKVIDYLGGGEYSNISFDYIIEDKPLGTIGALKLIKEFSYEHLLITNCDLLTNINYEEIYKNFLNEDADMVVASIPYNVDIPYATLKLKKNIILSFKEKPTYTYFSNAGIYIIKKELLKYIPDNKFFNATDLMDILIKKGFKLIHSPIIGYWMDIGKFEDFTKAKEFIRYMS